MAMKTTPIEPVFLHFLTCSHCNDIYKDPRILSCNHTYCYHCLLEMKQKELCSCPQCKFPLPPNSENFEVDQKTTQLLEKVLKGEEECTDEGVDHELNNWFMEQKLPEVTIKALKRDGYWDLDVVLAMTEADISQLGLLPGLEKSLVLKISKYRHPLTCQSTAPTSKPPPYISRMSMGTANSNQYNIDEYIGPSEKWEEVEKLYDERALMVGSQPKDSLRFWLSVGETEWAEVLTLVKEQGRVVKENKKLANDVKAERFRKIAVVLCDAGAYDDGVEYARLAVSFTFAKGEIYNTKALLVYAIYRKIAETKWGQNVDHIPLHKELIDLCDDVIKNQSDLLVSKLCKVNIQKAFALNRLFRLESSMKNASYLKTAQDSLLVAIKLCKKHDLKGLLAEALYCQGCVRVNQKGREKGQQSLLLARQLCIQEFGEFSILSFRIYNILGYTFQGKVEDKTKEYECTRRSWLIRKHTRGANHPDTLRYGEGFKERFGKMAEDTMSGSESEYSAGDKNDSKRLEFLDQMMKFNPLKLEDI